VDDDNALLPSIAAAVADGFPVNWAGAESTPMTPEDRSSSSSAR